MKKIEVGDVVVILSDYDFDLGYVSRSEKLFINVVTHESEYRSAITQLGLPTKYITLISKGDFK